jgi:hypothetical protein
MMRASTAELLESKSFPVGFIMLFMSNGFPLKTKIILFENKIENYAFENGWVRFARVN